MGGMAISLDLAPGRTAIDPVCGMTVTVGQSAGEHAHGGTTYHFCAESCRRKFIANPSAYLAGGGAQRGMRSAERGVPKSSRYICPMDPEVESDGPGICPKCGMALEPAAPTLDDRPGPELLDMTRRLRVGLIFGGPLFVVAMLDMAFAHAFSQGLGHRRFLLLHDIHRQQHSSCGQQIGLHHHSYYHLNYRLHLDDPTSGGPPGYS